MRIPCLFECFLEPSLLPKSWNFCSPGRDMHDRVFLRCQTNRLIPYKTVIDPATGIMYFYAKSYINGQAGPQGTLLGQNYLPLLSSKQVLISVKGVYKLWALQLPGLGDVPGFPVTVNGPTVNDKTRYFVGGTLMQRPGLTMIGDSIIAGFGGHCDSMNFTGMLVAVSKTPGKGVTSIYAMEAAPGKAI